MGAKPTSNSLTPYAVAWRRFRDSLEFRQLLDMGKALGLSDMNEEYFINRFRRAFDRGWTARGHLEERPGEPQLRGRPRKAVVVNVDKKERFAKCAAADCGKFARPGYQGCWVHLNVQVSEPTVPE